MKTHEAKDSRRLIEILKEIGRARGVQHVQVLAYSGDGSFVGATEVTEEFPFLTRALRPRGCLNNFLKQYPGHRFEVVEFDAENGL